MGIDARIVLKMRGDKPSQSQLKDWSWRVCQSIGAKHFFTDDNKTHPRLAISLTSGDEESGADGKVYFQDGDPIFAKDGEWLLRVSVWSRYYGVGYERGDILTICAICEWCEANIPNCTVYYGGDSSGVCLEPFGEDCRIALRKHLYSAAGRNYFERGIETHWLKSLPPVCSLCPDDGARLRQYGWGAKYAALHCAGCGIDYETRDNGETWAKKEPS